MVSMAVTTMSNESLQPGRRAWRTRPGEDQHNLSSCQPPAQSQDWNENVVDGVIRKSHISSKRVIALPVY